MQLLIRDLTFRYLIKKTTFCYFCYEAGPIFTDFYILRNGNYYRIACLVFKYAKVYFLCFIVIILCLFALCTQKKTLLQVAQGRYVYLLTIWNIEVSSNKIILIALG